MRNGALRHSRLLAMVLLGGHAIAAHAAEVTMRDDNFRPYREYTTGPARISNYPNLIATELIARVDRKSRAAATLVSMEIAYTGDQMRNYESARNARAESLGFQQIGRSRSCEKRMCTYDETFTVEIPPDELRRAPPGGYQFKVFGRGGGDALITVPKGAIDRLLGAVDKQRR